MRRGFRPTDCGAMRVCLASNLYPPDVIGGAELIVADIARTLREQGHEVSVLTTARIRDVGTETADGIVVRRLPPANLYFAGDAPRKPKALKPLWHAVDLWNPIVYATVRRALERERVDVLHSHNLGGLSAAVWSAAVAAGVSIVHTTHDYALTCVRSLRMRPGGQICRTPCGPCGVRGRWLRHLSRHVAAVAAPSRFVLEQHTAEGFFPNAVTAVTRWGLRELPPHRPAPPSPPVRFLYLGLLREHKGVRAILTAFGRLDRGDVRLDIAGAGELAEECRAAAARDPRIEFHGWVAGESKRRLLGRSHVLLAPSASWEVSGLAVLEAFGHGVPAIASRMGGLPELVEDGVTGVLVAPGDATALTTAMHTLVDDPGALARLGRAGRARAEALRLEDTVGDIVDLYRRALSVEVRTVS